MNKIAFFKTHKCASSTIQNLLLRQAVLKNLTVALPRDNSNYFYKNSLQVVIVNSYYFMVISFNLILFNFLVMYCKNCNALYIKIVICIIIDSSLES